MYKHQRKRQPKRRWFCIFLVGVLLFSFIFLNKNIKKSEISFNNKPDTLAEVNSGENDSLFEQLKALLNQDSRIQEIVDHYNSYPQELIDLLIHDMDTLEFVLAYPKKNGQIYADSVGNIQTGSIPLLLQWDERWGYGQYGDNILAITGCAPTALSMVITGLTGNPLITPSIVARYAENNDYYIQGMGSSWSLISQGSQHFGVQAEELSLSKENIYDHLKMGNPIICSMRPGDFTTTGHFIVLTGIENGKIRVNDPNSIKRSNKLWDYSTLQYQIDNLWSFILL